MPIYCGPAIKSIKRAPSSVLPMLSIYDYWRKCAVIAVGHCTVATAVGKQDVYGFCLWIQQFWFNIYSIYTILIYLYLLSAIGVSLYSLPCLSVVFRKRMRSETRMSRSRSQRPWGGYWERPPSQWVLYRWWEVLLIPSAQPVKNRPSLECHPLVRSQVPHPFGNPY